MNAMAGRFLHQQAGDQQPDEGASCGNIAGKREIGMIPTDRRRADRGADGEPDSKGSAEHAHTLGTVFRSRDIGDESLACRQPPRRKTGESAT